MTNLYKLNTDMQGYNQTGTKEDMLNQMRNVRDIPVSQSSANSQPEKKSDNDNVFDAIAGLDNGLDSMFDN